MRKWTKIIIAAILLAGGATLCAIRWQAWFGTPSEPKWTGDTISYVFPTFANDSVQGFERTPQGWRDTQSPKALDLLVLGDIHSRLTRKEYDLLAERVPEADGVLQIGDWLERGQFYYQQLLVREWTNSRLVGKPVMVCPGNHEYSKGVKKSLSPYWLELFPACGQSYFVDFERVRFIVIDTNPLVRLVDLTRALTWLETAIKSADGRYVVVMMHHPVLSAAKGRANVTLYATFRYALRQADLVIAGHDHLYMRKASFVVLNTAGPTKAPKHHLPSEAVSYDEPAYGVLHLDSLPLSLRIYRLEDGVLLDSLYVEHH